MSISIKEKIERSKPYLNKNFHVKEIGIFGSYVKGVLDRYSDIDILVEFEDGHRDFFNYMRLKYYLENMFRRKVDLIMKKAIKPMLKKRILSEVEYV
jgi:predicted nucleotidyltransferase